MSIHRITGRLFGASALGLLTISACAGAAPAQGARESMVGISRPNEVEPLTKGPTEASKKGKDGEGAEGKDATPRCPYGELSDPHRGFIRCLTPEERDADWLPPPPQREPPRAEAPKDGGKDGSSKDGSKDGSSKDGSKDGSAAGPPPDNTPPPAPPPAVPEPAPPAVPPLVEMGAPKFENGEVTRVDKALSSITSGVGKCIADNGGLSGVSGSMTVSFLVRVRGRAEGVEVSKRKGVSAEAGECIRKLLKNKAIGAPSADPVGVSFTISLKSPPK